MDEIIEKIQSLPEITLNDKELDFLTAIMNDLPVKSGEELITFIKDNHACIKLSNKHISALIKYCQEWQHILDLLLNWNTHLNEIWFSFKKKLIGADDLLPLTITFLPDNSEKLILLKSKLESALMIEQDSFYGFLTVSFYCSLEAKLQQLSEPTSAIEFDPLFIQHIKEEMNHNEVIDILKRTCGDYVRLLHKYIKQEIVKDKLAYLYYFNRLTKLPPSKAETAVGEVMDEMLSDLKTSKKLLHPDLYILLENNQLFLLLDKYAAIKSMETCLHDKEKSSIYKIKSFIGCYILHEEVLLIDGDYAYNSFLDKFTCFFGQNRAYHASIWETREGKLLKSFQLIAEQKEYKELSSQNTFKNT